MTAKPISCPMNVDMRLPSGRSGRGGDRADVDAEDTTGQSRRHACHVGAQIQFHGVPFPLQLLCGRLQRRHHLVLGTGSRVLDHLTTLGPGFVAVRRRLDPGLGHDFVVIGLGGLELLVRLLVVGKGLGDHRLALTQHLQDRRYDERADDGEDDQEDGENEEYIFN